MGQKVLGDFDVNAVARMVVKQGTNTLTLAQKDERWVVTERADYPANFSEVGETLRKLWDLKTVQPVAGPRRRPGTSGTGPGRRQQTCDLGGTPGQGRQGPRGRHPRQAAPAQARRSLPHGRRRGLARRSVRDAPGQHRGCEPRPRRRQRAQARGARLNRDFFKVEKVKSVAVTHLEGTNSWKLSRASETNEWVLADLQPAEKWASTKTGAVSSTLAWLSFEDVLRADDPSMAALEKPTVAVLETTEGFTYTVKAAPKGARRSTSSR